MLPLTESIARHLCSLFCYDHFYSLSYNFLATSVRARTMPLLHWAHFFGKLLTIMLERMV